MHVATLVGFLFLVGLIQGQSASRTVPTLVSFETRDFTFCDMTNSFFLISDAHPGEIFELDGYGRLQRTWFVEEGPTLSGIDCQSDKGLLHVATNNYRSIITLAIPTSFENGKDDKSKAPLQILEETTWDVGSWNVTENCLGGFALNPLTREFIITRSNPPLLLMISSEGEVARVIRVPFSKSISRVDVDEYLGVLWILSEEERTIYQTDLSGRSLYHQWELSENYNYRALAVYSDSSSPTDVLYLLTVPTRNQAVGLIYEFDCIQGLLLEDEVSTTVSSNFPWYALYYSLSTGAMLLVAMICMSCTYCVLQWRKGPSSLPWFEELVDEYPPETPTAPHFDKVIDQALLAV